MFRTIINYFKIQRILKDVYKNEALPEKLTKLFGVECKVDWVGRLYFVINPILQNVNTDGNTLVYDHKDKLMIETWVMRNLDLIKGFVINNSLFDILTYSITKIDDDDNYLVVFKNVYFDDMKKGIKIGSIVAASLFAIGIALLVIF